LPRAEYATESEVFRDGLRALIARDRAVENWLSKDVAGAFDALKQIPRGRLGIDKVRAKLASKYRKAAAKA